MIKLKSLLEAKNIMSEQMRWHYDQKISITENIFRQQSEAHFNLIVEARKLYESGLVTFEGRDKELFETTDVGLYAEYCGKQVPLDYPMENVEMFEDDNPCWKGYEMIGMKEKDGKQVPNCVPINEAEYKGKKVSLGKPSTGGPKKWYVYVRNDKGNVIRVTYGQPGMSANWNDPEARKSFAARHKCHLKKDRTTAGYWACRAHKDFGKNVSGRYW